MEKYFFKLGQTSNPRNNAEKELISLINPIDCTLVLDLAHFKQKLNLLIKQARDKYPKSNTFEPIPFFRSNEDKISVRFHDGMYAILYKCNTQY